RVLNVLEARQTNRVVGQVIGSTRVSVGDCGHAKIGQRCDPLLEDWTDGEVLLCVDSAYLSGAVVGVVGGVGGFPFLGCGELAALTLKAGDCGGVRVLRFGQLAEVVCDVALRTEEP